MPRTAAPSLGLLALLTFGFTSTDARAQGPMGGMGGMGGGGMGGMGGGGMQQGPGSGGGKDKKEGPAEAAPKDKKALQPIEPVPAQPRGLRQLQLFEIHGYMRMRADYFHRLDLGMGKSNGQSGGSSYADSDATGTKFFPPPAVANETHRRPARRRRHQHRRQRRQLLRRPHRPGHQLRQGRPPLRPPQRLWQRQHALSHGAPRSTSPTPSRSTRPSTPSTTWSSAAPPTPSSATPPSPPSTSSPARKTRPPPARTASPTASWSSARTATSASAGASTSSSAACRTSGAWAWSPTTATATTAATSPTSSVSSTWTTATPSTRCASASTSARTAATPTPSSSHGTGPPPARPPRSCSARPGTPATASARSSAPSATTTSTSGAPRSSAATTRPCCSASSPSVRPVVNYGAIVWLRSQAVDRVTGSPGLGDGLGTNPTWAESNTDDGLGRHGASLGNGDLDEVGDSGIQNYANLLMRRRALVLTPDIWVRVNWKTLRVELEGSGVVGRMYERDLERGPSETGFDYARIGTQNLTRRGFLQFGYALEFKYGLFKDRFHLGLDHGFASGDASGSFNPQSPRITDGLDSRFTNFRFNPAYMQDLLLFRELLGTASNAAYFKPWMAFYFFDNNFSGRLDIEYAIAHQRIATFGQKANYGLELDAAFRYHDQQEPIFVQLQYGVMFPFGAFNRDPNAYPTAQNNGDAKAAQTIQAQIGIKF